MNIRTPGDGIENKSFSEEVLFVGELSLMPFDLSFSQRPIKTIGTQLIRPKDPLTGKDQSNGIYDIPCQDCDCHYVGGTRKRLETRLKQHQSAAKRHCPRSQIYEHMALTGHSFNFDEAKMIATSRRKGTRVVLQSWLSDNKAVNRRIDLHIVYQALRRSRKKINPTRRLTENQTMGARQQSAAATSGNINSYSTIDRLMTGQLARQLSDSGRQHILSIEPTTS